MNLFKKVINKDTNKIIEEIHETFYTEVDKLLQEAKIYNSLDTDKQLLINKSERLEKLGFINTKEVQEAKVEISRLDELKKENELKQDLIESINYFSIKYPIYKFITEDSVKKICNKYKLIYSSINNYIDTVPDENLQRIEEFKIDENDKCFIIISTLSANYDRDPYSAYISKQEYKKYLKEKENNHSSSDYKFLKCSLEIVAPPSYFNLKNTEIKSYQLIKKPIPDPIVLQPVIFKYIKHYLIITAWGKEASDELITNEKMN